MSDPRRPCLYVFAKGPRLGVGKTRLASKLGQVEALRINRMLQQRGLRAAQDARWDTRLMVSPPAALAGAFPNVWPSCARLERELQGGGGLGERLAVVFRRWGPTAVIGVDCPEISSLAIHEGWRALRRARFSIGPAVDGGFWFFAARCGWEAVEALRGPVRWSTRHTARDLLAALPAPTAEVRTLADIDDRADWHAFLARQRAARGRMGARPEASLSSSAADSAFLNRQRA